MKTRHAVGVRAKFITGVFVGSLAFVGGADAVVPAAYAQAAKPAAKPKPEAKAAAPAAGGALDKKALTDAKKHYGDGETKYKAGDYAGALAEFQAADSVKSTPQAARYIGLCYDNLGKLPDAVGAYERFLANVPPKMTMQGDEIKARVATIKQLPGKLHLDSDPKGATVTIDGKPQPNATPTDVEVPAGHHVLHFTAPDRDAVDRSVDITFAAKQDVMATLPASAAPPPPVAVVAPVPPVETTPPPVTQSPDTTPAPTHHSKLPAFITGGLAVAAAGVGTVFGIMALSDKSDFDKAPTTQKADDGENHALIADMAFGVAVTLGVTSAVLFLSGGDDAPPAAAASVKGDAVAAARPKTDGISFSAAPIVTPHGGGAGAVIRF